MIVVRSNLGTVTAVLIRDMGILIPPAGGSETFTDLSNINDARVSDDLRAYCTDGLFPGPPDPSDNTLILNDGVNDVPPDAIDEFLGDPFVLREVVLGQFTATVVVGTAINIRTGVYAGAGSPVAVVGDTDITLPASGAAFRGDGRIEATLNGQDLTRGDGTGNGEIEWVSTTQVKLNIKIKPMDELLVRAPYPTA
jgi:hypothetical protein